MALKNFRRLLLTQRLVGESSSLHIMIIHLAYIQITENDEEIKLDEIEEFEKNLETSYDANENENSLEIKIDSKVDINLDNVEAQKCRKDTSKNIEIDSGQSRDGDKVHHSLENESGNKKQVDIDSDSGREKLNNDIETESTLHNSSDSNGSNIDSIKDSEANGDDDYYPDTNIQLQHVTGGE